MIHELLCYFDTTENDCRCGAETGDHQYCTHYLPANVGSGCSHLLADTGGCANAYACFEAYAAAIKEKIKGDENEEGD